MRLMNLKLWTVAVSVGFLTGLGSLPAVAQSSQPSEPLQDLKAEDPNDPSQVLSDRAGPGSLFNLLNRLQQVNGRSSGEFAEEQSTNFDSAVDAFRKKQQEQLQAPTPSTPDAVTPIESKP